ncbi:MAG: hypothetical protein ACD_38C00012G0010 [uncultured bacterium]|uniref:Trehalase-like protein n=1 Tax=Candidatus Daviesbacteria bacterium GW2011_GWC2_40_12 TaxID=1618431 RepID=A0A0G0QQ77_9BACT|nr:MAG: hypothetical protein ACD_38C00012G0010 [uncultured bacterium]KKR16354.1 MAG: Trehalase-like protein [Candidatus Daviesbacteria bacterium GW2011_GWA2_39_33]KKR42273.1 MAG: Trehalase-like protein [Candidatus Daviesbacteria bacterium GW2011_GWC2_40_12]OGE22013.1 MAG: hypothetical protein A2778_01715 [Candidatus Daviesbacteria bacterium RIFCSPHIGHO2_01_FULL_40_24]OGE28678.1 MAG: hypothetical protein A3C29_03810 [Candidatus Daviesbacteria bacterium RIFCSPHIGHO2_02_FULL_40_16]OGE42911.1 MAG:
MLKKLTNEYQKLLLNNRRQTDGFSYTIPSPDTYPYQWLWDSCFHAIILSGLNIEDAKAEILSLLSQQFQNGMIPHMIYWENHEKVTFPKIQWGKDVTSTITQPPMIAYAIWQIFQKDKEVDFLKNTYRHLYHFYRYLLNERDPHEKHLIGIMNPDESGEDNSPRFDLPLGLPPQHTFEENIQKRLNLVAQNIECKFDAPFCMRNFFWVKDVPFNAIMVENLRILSQIASKLDFGEDASFFAAEAEKIVLAMRKYMFEDNLFWPTFGENYQKIKIKTWAIFAPLFAQILTKKEAEDLVEKHLLNPREFWTEYKIPTVSIDEPSFDPKSLWRGPVWIGTNWFIYKGLKNYGFLEIAQQIKDSSLKLLSNSGFREYFNPQTGEGLGAKNFTWGGLILDMD